MHSKYNSRISHITVLAVILLYLPGTLGAATVNELIAEKGAIFPYILDTVTPIPETPDPIVFVDKDGWTLIAEDTTDHSFQGDTIILNDRILIIVRKNGSTVDIYSLLDNGPAFRARLTPATEADSPPTIDMIRIVENTPGAVEIAVGFAVERIIETFAFRLTPASSIVEIICMENTDSISIRNDSEYVVIPNFFADDMVFGGSAVETNSVFLPAEQFLLALGASGDSIVTAVWDSPAYTAKAIFSDQTPQSCPNSLELDLKESAKIWLAFLETPGIWSTRSSPEGDSGQKAAPSAPFPAKWRINLLKENGFAISQTCETEFPSTAEQDSFLLYPIDRTKDTPITQFCPVDILRNTLGVGPCQYVLDSEKIAVEDYPTPDRVADWIGNLFSKNRQSRYAEQIQKKCTDMLTLLSETRSRIDGYRACAKEIAELCKTTEQQNPNMAQSLRKIQMTIETMESDISRRSADSVGQESMETLCSQILTLVAKPDSAAEMSAICSKMRSIGAVDDYALSKCRMSFRWMDCLCRMGMEQAPDHLKIYQEIQNIMRNFLARE